MSTAPGAHGWRDAGLVEPGSDEPVSLAEEADADAAEEVPARGEDYHPRTARPDLDGLADEADVAEQADIVPGDEPADDED
ncbi:hypothetical protein LQF12_05985 [Ruania suaedae]|uniref:hypothetical protein n=1 Tax=Ruania suaedae TaxID=2897774 RepID=UPI001E4C0879|nr:hypothetical protein [Ruania suaedae]UFU04135.1 hypothetical protein LQF12_05985 [Ruania suaedae]